MNRLNFAIEPLDARLYAVAYQVGQKDGSSHLDLWQESLAIGGYLPILPLFLIGGFYLRILPDLRSFKYFALSLICCQEIFPYSPS
jgi:hypothetical protein